jgi:DHA1 family tetracycline resistance protein-like MFS transporter
MMLVLGIVVFVSFVGVGIVVPLFPFFAARIGAAPEMITTMMAVFAFGQLVSTPFWGWASDRIGRKPVLLLSLLGAALSYLLLAYADSIKMLLLSRLIGGLMTGIGAVAFAVIADISSGVQRARGMGRISAAFSLGFILGPAFGGLLAGSDAASTDYRMIAFVAAALDVAALLLALAFVRETRPMQSPVAATSPAQHGSGVLARSLRTPQLRRLFIVHLLFAGSFAVVDSTLPIFAAGQHQFSPREVGYAFTAMGAVSAAAQALAIGWLVRRAGPVHAVTFGLLMFLLGHLAVAGSTGGAMLLAGLVALAIGMSAFIAPASNLVTAAAAEHERGTVLGLFQGAGNLGRTLTPLFSGLLFTLVGPRAPFLAAAVLILPALWLLLRERTAVSAAQAAETS